MHLIPPLGRRRQTNLSSSPAWSRTARTTQINLVSKTNKQKIYLKKIDLSLFMFQCILSPKPHYLDFKEKSRWNYFNYFWGMGWRREFLPWQSWRSENCRSLKLSPVMNSSCLDRKHPPPLSYLPKAPLVSYT